VTLQEGDPSAVGGYRLERRLGAGGMGVVFLGRSVSGRLLAIKVIRPDLVTDEGFRIRFRREVEAARQVSGAFTAPVVDADPDAEQPWLATLFVPGPSLHRHVTDTGPLGPTAVRRLAAGLAEALRDIHRAGLVHRDLKPGNVLLADDGPRVIDFGIARAVTAAPLTTTGVVIGTPGYMAPEQLRTGGTGPEGDVFALGSVLVFAATGHGPFDGESSYGVGYRVVHEDPDLTGVPGGLRPLVAGCLAKEPGGRPTVDELLAALSEPADEPPPAPAAPAAPAPADTPTRPDAPPAAGETGSFRPGPPAPAEPPLGFPVLPLPPPAVPPPLVPRDVAPRRSRRKRTAVVVTGAVLALTAAVTVPLLVLHDHGGDHASAGGTGKGASSSPRPKHSASASPASPSAAPFSCAGAQGTVTASGSSQLAPLVDQWVEHFQARCPGATVNYTAMGSGAGLAAFLSGQSDFAVQDAPLDQESVDRSHTRCDSKGGGQAVDIPLAATPEAVVYNLPGVTDLVLDAPTLAKIFDGRITRWNDDAIAALNPHATLPGTAVRAVHRADETGSTWNLTTYLRAAAGPAAWPHAPGTAWRGTGGVGSTGATGLEHEVGTVPGSIGYTDYRTGGTLATALLKTGAVPPVAVGSAATTVFLAHASTGGSGFPGGSLVLTPTYADNVPNAYPLALVNYAVVCSKGNTSETLAALRAFLTYATGAPGRQDATALGYGPMPNGVLMGLRPAIAALD
jgi:phosphate ABC transporter phosphate-binding protein